MLVPAALDDLDVDDRSSFFTTVDVVASSTFICPPSFFDAAFRGKFKDKDPPAADKCVGLSFETLDEQGWELSR